MNTQKKTAAKIFQVVMTALILVTLLYGALPAQRVYASSFLVNDLGDQPDPSLDGICDISPGDFVENCTLRAALMEANRVDDIDVISFTGPMTLNPASAYPVITQPVTIDATSTGGRVTLDGGGGTFVGLNITASGVTVRRLALVNFDGTAIRVAGGADGTIIDNNYLGVRANGTTDGGNTDKGIRVVDSPNTQITGNLISGNDTGGIVVSGAASDGVVITGNIIGLNAAGTARLEATPTTGADGIRLSDVTNATIGGSAVANRNIISGNYGNAIVVSGLSTGTVINGNYIGTTSIGEDPIPNLSGGIRLNSADGVDIGSSSGNLISGNDAPGIVASSSSNGKITGNLIGLDVDGDTAMPNTAYGINVDGSTDFIISANTISANTGSGIRLVNGVTGFNIHSNRIGLGKYSNIDLGNTNHGIYIDNSNDNTIGNTNTSYGNTIAFNDGKGIYILNTNSPTYNSYGNSILGNKIYSNGDLGIDLFPSGPTANDTSYPNNGPNHDQNYITFTAKDTDTGVQITGQLNTDPARPNYRIEFFRNNSCDASGYGEGTTRVDAYTLAISAATTAIDYEIPVIDIQPGEFITATVTYDEGTGGLKDTSEFSPCAVVQEPDSPGSSGVFVVNSTADTSDTNVGDGQCNAPGGVCTLRAAIQEANAGSTPPYTISFSISGTAPYRISLGSALPTITVPVLIKGKNAGYSGPPLVEIDGSGAGGVSGFTINEPGVQIDGLSIINFGSASAVLINTTGTTISNNYIGLQADGTTSAGNQVGVTVNGQSSNLIRNNLVSSNLYGVRLVGSASQDNTIRSNYIGTDSGGTLDKGNTSDGVRLEGARNNQIELNTISGNNGDGIEISGGSSGNRIFQNNIGTYSSGSGSLPNSGNGVNLNTATDNFISNSNTIRNNGLNGVYVSGGSGNQISENSIAGNSADGIQLVSGGNNNTPSPFLTSASSGGSYVYVEGQLSGALSSTTYTLEFFSSTAGDQGETYIFTSTVTTDGSGNATFTAGPPVSLPVLTIITATATDPTNNTSEFSNYVLVVGSAPVLTNTPTFTPTFTLTPSPTVNYRPTNTFTPTPTNTNAPGVPTNTNTPPTNTPNPTSTSSGPTSTSGPANTLGPTSSPTITETPTITYTPTLLGPYMTLTELAANITVEPSNTPETPTSTFVPTATKAQPTETPTATLPPTETPVDGTGGGGGEPAEPASGEGDLIGDLLGGGGSSFSTILWIFIGLAVLLLLVGGGMELMRWMNSRGD